MEYIVKALLVTGENAPDFSEFQKRSDAERKEAFRWLFETLDDQELTLLVSRGFPLELHCMCTFLMNADLNEQFMLKIDILKSHNCKIDFKPCCFKYLMKCINNMFDKKVLSCFYERQYLNAEATFILSCRHGFWNIAKDLLENGVNINTKCIVFGSTALMHAAQTGHSEIVKELIARGADINMKNKNGYDAYHYASIYDIVSMINTAKVKAERLGKQEEFEKMEPKEKVAFEKFWESHKSHKKLQLAKKYLDKGYPISTLHAGDFCHLACEYGNLELIKCLMSFNVKVFSHSLSVASLFGHLDIVIFLYERSETGELHSVIRSDKSMGSALLNACAGKHADVVDFLLTCKEIHFAKDRLLNVATKDPKILKKILPLCMERINNKDTEYDLTALMDAAIYGVMESVNILIDAGADVGLMTDDGMCAYDYAKSWEMKFVIDPERFMRDQNIKHLQEGTGFFEKDGKKYILILKSRKIVDLSV